GPSVAVNVSRKSPWIASTPFSIASRYTYRLRPTDVKEAIDRILDMLTEALAEDQHIEIRDFGSFDIRVMPAKQSRNPKTGEPVWVPAKKTVHFKPGYQMRTQVTASVQHG
ncbi:HU family DNA-binding protein, partial [Acidithiobacillus ferrooxidans]|uniref:HU family DNA-binding protein n=1 Tax=Acidithiobacillus ferrooxidans TaxID=920 RepID=UPI001D0109BC